MAKNKLTDGGKRLADALDKVGARLDEYVTPDENDALNAAAEILMPAEGAGLREAAQAVTDGFSGLEVLLAAQDADIPDSSPLWVKVSGRREEIATYGHLRRLHAALASPQPAVEGPVAAGVGETQYKELIQRLWFASGCQKTATGEHTLSSQVMDDAASALLALATLTPPAEPKPTVPGNDAGMRAALAKEFADLAERVEAIHHQTYRHLNGKPLEQALIDIGNLARNLRGDIEKRAREFASDRGVRFRTAPIDARGYVDMSPQPPKDETSAGVGDEVERDAARWRFTQAPGYFYLGPKDNYGEYTGYSVGVQRKGDSVNNSVIVRGCKSLTEAIDRAISLKPALSAAPAARPGDGVDDARGVANVFEALWRDAEDEAARLASGFWPSDAAIAEAFHEHRRETQPSLPPWSEVMESSGIWKHSYDFATRLSSLRLAAAPAADGGRA